jgi:membrane-bound serine protease (ClpP class)
MPRASNITAMRTRFVLFAVLVMTLVAGSHAAAQGDREVIVVVDIEGPADQVLLDFVTSTIAETEAQLFVLRVDSPGISSGDPGAMYESITQSPIPVAVWVGPRPAVAHGGMGQLLGIADFAGAAPGVEVGYLLPGVVGAPSSVGYVVRPSGDWSQGLADSVVALDDPVPGLVPELTPTIGQFIASLDGRTARGVTLETARTIVDEDGSESVVASVSVQFVKPDLWDRFLRLGSRPEAAFFFLLVGLAAVAFEFYAAGVGVTAAVGVLSLFIAGYGLATLPMNWLAVAGALLGMLLLTIDFQRNRLGLVSGAGVVLLFVAGMTFTTAAPQYSPRWWAVLLTVVGIAAFYAVALTTIARSRFSTRTLGRERLIGKRGIAETGFDPEGVVVVEGARWRARSHRAAGIRSGDEVEVMEVSGITLEIAPVATQGVRE